MRANSHQVPQGKSRSCQLQRLHHFEQGLATAYFDSECGTQINALDFCAAMRLITAQVAALNTNHTIATANSQVPRRG
jgi:hypothetical protein